MMAIPHNPPVPPRPVTASGKRDKNYKFNEKLWRWERKTQYQIDSEKALARLDREFPGYVEP